MISSFGEKLKIIIEGGSHSQEISASVIGLPKGEPINEDLISVQMARRAPEQDSTSTARREPDKVEIITGLEDGVTNGDTLKIVIKNSNTNVL